MNRSLFKVSFKLPLVLGIIVSMLLMTSLSCNKAAGDKNNANDNGSGNEVTVDGCKTGTIGTNICFENFEADVAQQLADGSIQLKASGLPTAVSADIANTDITAFKAADATKFKKAFDLTIKVDGTAAKEGLVIVGPGSLADANDFSIGQGIAQGLTDYSAALRKEGIVSEAATAAGTFLQQGWNILSSFMNNSNPTDETTADANASPFSFSATTGTYATKPVFFCRTTLSEITSDAAVKVDTKLTGGQTATCYVGVVGVDFTGKAGEDWLNTTAGNTFKKKFNIAVAGIKTDGKTITNVGLTGADDNAKITKFKDGLDKADMTALTGANVSKYRKVAVEVVRGTFMHTPPVEGTITFENFDTDLAVPVGDDTNTIQLKASGFATAVSADIANTDISVVKTAAAAKFKRAFDIKVSSGNTAATGGLVLVGPGNLANTNDFSISQGVAQVLTDYSAALRKEGIVSEAATADVNDIVKAGWNILTPFMNNGAPIDAATADADASPFAFTATTGTFPTKPILFCKTTLSAITGAAAVQANTQLTGGQTASCYVGVLGSDFIDKAGNDWLDTTAGNTFKKKFNIAVAGVQTDGDTINDIGLLAADRVAAFKDGISTAEMAQITEANPSAHKKVAIEVVRGTLPTYTAPAAGTIKFENFDTSVAELVGGTIQLKADGFPTGDVAALNSDINAVKTSSATHLKRAFDITIESGGNDAAEGLVLVGPGNLADINAFSIDKRVDQGFGDYSAALRKEGIVSDAAAAADAHGLKAGWNILSPFMNDTAPTSAAADTSPFAFTATGGAIATHPILVCRTTISSITSAAAVQADTKLTGSETASCYVGALGKAFTGKAAEDWLNTTAGNTFKKRFEIAVAGVKTDGKTIANLGLPGVDKAAAFRDGISQAEMRDLATVNSSKYTNIAVEVVRAGFTYTPPAVSFINFDTDVRTNGTGDTIQIKAGAFPATAAGGTAAAVNDLTSAPANSLKRVFDITITGGYAGTATGGLVMVGPGSHTDVDSFSDPIGFNFLNGNLKDGYGTGTPRTTTFHAEVNPAGWSVYGAFMNEVAPTSANADASPFAFTASGGSQPFLFCRATMTQVTYGRNTMLANTVTFEGGQTAHCYIGSKGTAFGAQSATWLGTAASATFKKTFNIAIGAIRTDGDSYVKIISGADDNTKWNNFRDGLDSTEIADIMTRYPYHFKKISMTIVDDSTW